MIQSNSGQNSPEQLTYNDSTYVVVSKVAYLIGVPQKIFENEYEPPQMDVFQKMELDKNARIIRHLCIIRTAIERNFRNINDKMRDGYSTILSLPQYVPAESTRQLMSDGISFVKRSASRLSEQIVEINRIISDRINNCKHLFPIWLNWLYIRELFIMPDGLSEFGTKEAASVFYGNMSLYPYQVYLNWEPADVGNILYNDKKFVTLLYSWHHDTFTDLGKVSDAGSFVKSNIYGYIDDSEKVVFVVDCENADPYRLSATLRGLDRVCREKILSIILFDDVHASTGWDLLESVIDIPVEHLEIERVKQNKSLVDMRLAMRVSQEFYENGVDSFVLASSDSDYWALISSLPRARFLVMVEHEKCGPDLKAALAESGIFYCYTDDFYSGDFEELKMRALFREMGSYIRQNIQFNLNTMLDMALQATRIEMKPAERTQFYNKYLKTIQLEISDNGDVSLSMNA
jgi:hypothetical protein